MFHGVLEAKILQRGKKVKDLDLDVHIFVGLFRCILFKFLPRCREILELSYKPSLLVITARAFSVIL